MGDLLQLPLDGGIDPGMIVSVEVGPDRGVGIQIFPAARISQQRPLPFNDDDGFALEPIPHLGERVPEVAVVEFGKRVHGLKNRNPKSEIRSAEA